MFFFIAYIIALTILFIAAFALIDAIRTKGSIARALNSSLFMVTLPRDII